MKWKEKVEHYLNEGRIGRKKFSSLMLRTAGKKDYDSDPPHMLLSREDKEYIKKNAGSEALKHIIRTKDKNNKIVYVIIIGQNRRVVKYSLDEIVKVYKKTAHKMYDPAVKKTERQKDRILLKDIKKR